MEILPVITFGACTALLKKSVENGHFRAFSPKNFQKVDRYGSGVIHQSFLDLRFNSTDISSYCNKK